MGFKIVEDRPTPPEVYNWRIYMTGVIIAFGAALFGYCASFIGTALKLPAFQRDFNLASDSPDNANIISVFQAGAFFASMAAYPTMENFGRKKTLIGTAALFNVGCILQIAATHQIGLIYAGRVVVGIAVGFVTTCCPVYLAELSPPAIRGRLVGFYEMAYQIMALVAFWLSYGIKQHMDLSSSVTWRIPFGLQLVPGGLLLIGCFFLKESPRYLLKRHRPEEATHNLCWLRMLPASHTYIEEELSATVVQINREKEVTAGYRGNAAMRYFRGMWHEVSTPGIRNRIVIGAFIMMWQNMSGINSINYYSPTLFASLGVEDTSLYTGIYGVLKAAASIFFFVFLVDTWGRRPPLMFGAITSGLCLLYVAVYLQVADPASQAVVSSSTHMGGQAAIAFLFLFSIFYCMGWNGLAWVVCAEIYPTRIRALCAAWTSCHQWLWQFIIARETPDMLNSRMGVSGTFFLFTACNLLSAVFVYFFIPETKGRTLEDMDAIFGLVRPVDNASKAETQQVEDAHKIKDVGKPQQHTEDVV
ncbi:sugar porter family MFS transporter [Rhodotorula paludigena]|uniref:sugar porter family MFS transporter n=1 Tax=Rhodotorula paludigena TaxID=86838 RepID=UPI00317B656A